jgi:adenylylsulfate reductase, subunit A
MAGEFGNPEVVQEEVDILLIGGGMAPAARLTS